LIALTWDFIKSEIMNPETGYSVPGIKPFAIATLRKIALKNKQQMIMSMRDELNVIGKGALGPSKNREEIELFKCKL
jgi:hypothetical protein